MLIREFSRRAQSVQDLMLWATLVAPGVVLNKDGSLTTGWTYQGPDLNSATAEELKTLSEQANRVLLGLDESWILHCDVLRSPAPAQPDSDAFEHPVTQAIDLERRFQNTATLYQTASVLLLTYLPASERASYLKSLFVTGGDPAPRGVDAHREELENKLAEIEQGLSHILRLKRLTDEHLLTHLHSILTGLSHPVRLPASPLLLDGLLCSQDLEGVLKPKIGDQYISLVSLTGLPRATTPGLLDQVTQLPFPLRVSTRWIPLSFAAADKVLAGYRRAWMRKRRGMRWLVSGLFGNPATRDDQDVAVDYDSAAMMADVDLATAERNAQAVRFGYLTLTVVLHHSDPTELASRSRAVSALIQSLGIPARIESDNTLDAFLGSIAPATANNVRRPMIHTGNLADLLPLTTVWQGRAVNPSPYSPPGGCPALLWTSTEGSTAFCFNLHAASDVGHSLILGPTGSGKSAIVSLLMAQWFRYEGARVIAFDKGGSFLPLTLALGGAHYDLAAQTSELSLCPLARVEDLHERSQCQEWLEDLFELNKVEMNPGRRIAIANALALLASQGDRTLTNFRLKVQDQELREALLPYTTAGSIGATLLDSPSDNLAEARLLTLEMAKLMEHGPRFVVPTLLYLFHRLTQRFTSGLPTLLVLDEGWTFLDHPKFAHRIRLWLKELRKYNVSVLFATQSLADFAATALAQVLVESTETKVFLPNPQAANEAVAPLYRSLGLNSRQLALIAGARAKSDYYVSCSEGNRLMRLVLGPLALSFCGAGSRQELAQVRKLAATHGSLWPAFWLQSRNLTNWAETLRPQLETLENQP
jgi:type IV secretion system protein VirB4